MRERSAELITASGSEVDVVVMTFTKQRNLSGYRRRFADPFTVVTDPDRTTYAALGFKRGNWWRIWGLRAAKTYASLMRSGHSIERSTFTSDEDKLQLGGNVIVDSTGHVTWVYRGAGPDDRPTVDQILTQLALLR